MALRYLPKSEEKVIEKLDEVLSTRVKELGMD
jgi:hypothetical protein